MSQSQQVTTYPIRRTLMLEIMRLAHAQKRSAYTVIYAKRSTPLCASTHSYARAHTYTHTYKCTHHITFTRTHIHMDGCSHLILTCNHSRGGPVSTHIHTHTHPRMHFHIPVTDISASTNRMHENTSSSTRTDSCRCPCTYETTHRIVRERERALKRGRLLSLSVCLCYLPR